jgi:RNA polymerase sigma factor (sigma-70 family)
VEPVRNVTSWLFTVARNKVIDFYRKKRPVNFSDMPMALEDGSRGNDPSLYLEEIYFDDVNDPQQNVLRTAVWDELEKALEGLPKEQREVFIAHELDGKSFNEISEETGLLVNTLLSRKRYAVVYLRKRLQLVYDELLND